ncbi:MAG TPA: biotin transporter BioY [bacterium]|nr:biotin transporter BioY [bacterium]
MDRATHTETRALPRPLNYALPALLAVGALTASAWLAFPHPFTPTPVPVTWQVLVVLVLGLATPSWLALSSVGAYLALGLTGAPVFAWGANGWIAFAGPSGGYLVGFLAAAGVMGLVKDKLGDKLPALILNGLAGIATIYLFGYVWLAVWIGDAGAAFSAGVLPFVAPDLLKLAGAVSVAHLRHRLKIPRNDA